MLGVLGALVSNSYADKRLGAARTLQRLTQDSDSVVVGECKGKKCNVVDRHFETDYEIEVKEQWKGLKHPSGSKVFLTVSGGRLTTPPLTQLVQAQPHMYPGENVVLFLDEKPVPDSRKNQAHPQSKLVTSPRVVGMKDGKFSILNDAATGKPKVTQLNLENMGYVHDDEVLERVLRAMATGEVNVTSGPAVQAAPSVVTPQMPSAKIPSSSGVVHELRGKSTLPPVQDFEDFKAQVRGFAN